LQAIKHVLILFELSHALLMSNCDFLNILIDIRKENPVEYECQVSYSQKYLVVSWKISQIQSVKQEWKVQEPHV